MTTDPMTAGSFDDPELRAERADEKLPLARLDPYLRDRLPATEGALRVAQFGGGKANLTYLLAFETDRVTSEYVLRRPPLGPVAPSAHDMGREHRVLSRLAEHFALAPMCYLHCTDKAIIGAEFQVMERRRGQVIREVIPEGDRDPETLQGIGQMLIDVLADFHRLDRQAVGLGDLGHPPGFVERQLEGWAKRWHAAVEEPNPAMDRLIAWLRDRLPTSHHESLLHNDYKLDNLLLDGADPTRAVAILDWDMGTSGDPLMDLGYLLNQWVEEDDDPAWIEASHMPSHTPGFPRRVEAIERYARRTGFTVDAIDWYHAFAAMKFAVIIQQIYIRYRRGQTQDERFADFGQRAQNFVDKGAMIAGL